jgi:hypothetical protein
VSDDDPDAGIFGGGSIVDGGPASRRIWRGGPVFKRDLGGP